MHQAYELPGTWRTQVASRVAPRFLATAVPTRLLGSAGWPGAPDGLLPEASGAF